MMAIVGLIPSGNLSSTNLPSTPFLEGRVDSELPSMLGIRLILVRGSDDFEPEILVMGLIIGLFDVGSVEKSLELRKVAKAAVHVEKLD